MHIVHSASIIPTFVFRTFLCFSTSTLKNVQQKRERERKWEKRNSLNILLENGVRWAISSYPILQKNASPRLHTQTIKWWWYKISNAVIKERWCPLGPLDKGGGWMTVCSWSLCDKTPKQLKHLLSCVNPTPEIMSKGKNEGHPDFSVLDCFLYFSNINNGGKKEVWKKQ